MELVPYTTAKEIAQKLPKLEDQIEYHRRVSALRDYAKDPALMRSAIEAEAALAETIKEALKRGDVKRTGDVYIVNAAGQINPNTVDRWRKVRAIGIRARQQYYAKVKKPSRNGLLKWHRTRTTIEQARNNRKPPKKSSASVIHGRWQDEHKKRIKDNSVELIFTDPPYFSEFVPEYGEMASLAMRVLVDGGSLLTYVGHRLMPQVMQLMIDQGMNFYWINAIVHGGRKARMPLTGQIVGFKPLLWFIKGKQRIDTSVFVEDTIFSTEEKTDHPWQQSLVEARYYIEQLSTEGGLVLDPYCGSGTTAVACKQLGRLWLTFDVDPDAVTIARKSICQV